MTRSEINQTIAYLLGVQRGVDVALKELTDNAVGSDERDAPPDVGFDNKETLTPFGPDKDILEAFEQVQNEKQGETRQNENTEPDATGKVVIHTHKCTKCGVTKNESEMMNWLPYGQGTCAQCYAGPAKPPVPLGEPDGAALAHAAGLGVLPQHTTPEITPEVVERAVAIAAKARNPKDYQWVFRKEQLCVEVVLLHKTSVLLTASRYYHTKTMDPQTCCALAHSEATYLQAAGATEQNYSRHQLEFQQRLHNTKEGPQ